MKTFWAMKLVFVALVIVRDNAATTTTTDMTTETSVASTSISSTTPTETTSSMMSTSSTFSMSTSAMSSNETTSVISTMTYNVTMSTTTGPSETSLLCLDGSCVGNISCLQEFENMTCYLREDQHCFVYTNFTNIFYTAGCSADCEETSIQAGTGNYTVSLARHCCDDRNRCNQEIQEASNSATSFRKFGVSGALLILLSFFSSV